MIRPLDSQETGLYRSIRSAALRTDPDAFGETAAGFDARSEAELEEWLARRTGLPDRTIFIDEVDGLARGMCGCGIYESDPALGFIWGMFVAPPARRLGVGAELLRAAIELLGSAGATCIRAQVAAPNEGAVRFYRAQGFTVGPPVGTLREGSDIPVHEIQLAVPGGPA